LLSRPPGTLLDLNGVVKGLAVDASLELLRGDGLVAARGDVAARGGVVVGLPRGEGSAARVGAVAGLTVRRALRSPPLVWAGTAALVAAELVVLLALGPLRHHSGG
jgi:hypothetical protein